MKAFLQPLQESCRDGKNSDTGEEESRCPSDKRMYGVPEGTYDIWAFRAFSISLDPWRR